MYLNHVEYILLYFSLENSDENLSRDNNNSDLENENRFESSQNLEPENNQFEPSQNLEPENNQFESSRNSEGNPEYFFIPPGFFFLLFSFFFIFGISSSSFSIFVSDLFLFLSSFLFSSWFLVFFCHLFCISFFSCP